jgi:wyosine [tRNA(Phe)-imidazoG37] synthetase (radical SAM superfamily)
MGQRRDFKIEDQRPSCKDVLAAVQSELKKNKKINCITFAGNSEPGAHPEFDQIVDQLITLRDRNQSEWRIIALTNGSELDQPHVRKAFDRIDEAWIKLDCATEDLFRRLNRAIARVGRLSDHIERMKQLKILRIQSLVWLSSSQDRLSNWTEENREGLLKLYQQLTPRAVHLITISRKPAIHSLVPVPRAELVTYQDRAIAAGVPVELY